MKVTRGKVMAHIGCTGFAIIIIAVILIAGTVIQYREENTVTATVMSITTQQHVSGTDGDVSTSYVYLVGTDKGTMQIDPSGIMASTAFGRLKEGCRYELHTRGYSVPFLGMYPYIVDAKQIDE